MPNFTLAQVQQAWQSSFSDDAITKAIESVYADIEERFGLFNEQIEYNFGVSYMNSIFTDWPMADSPQPVISDAFTDDIFDSENYIKINDSQFTRKPGKAMFPNNLKIQYTRRDDSKLRNAVALDLIKLKLEFTGNTTHRVGSTSKTQTDYKRDYEKIIARLQSDMVAVA